MTIFIGQLSTILIFAQNKDVVKDIVEEADEMALDIEIEPAKQVTEYISGVINDAATDEEKFHMLQMKIEQMSQDYIEFDRTEGTKCYLGIYTPRNYEAKIEQWLNEYYITLQNE